MEAMLPKIRYSIVFNRRNRKNNIIEKPIEIRAYQTSNSPIYISTGISIPPEFWDEKNKRIDVRYPLSNIYNKKIYDQLSEIEAYEFDIIRRQGSLRVQKIKEYSSYNADATKSFTKFCEYELSNSTDKKSTIKSHRHRLSNFFQKFKKGKEVYFLDINVGLIKQYDRYLKGLTSITSQNTIHGYHKTIKTYINKAIAEELVKDNPYSKFKVRKERDENIKREWLSLAEMKRIDALEFSEDERPMERIKDFILICLWCGFRFSLTSTLTPEDVKETKDGLVILKTKAMKTNKRIFMPLYLLGDKNEDGRTKPEQLFFDLLERRKKEAGRNEVFDKVPFFDISLQYLNRELKKLAKLAKIKKKMSSHIGRRSFIDLMVKEFGLPLPLVQKLATHSDIRTTMKYINQGDDAIIEELKKVNIIL